MDRDIIIIGGGSLRILEPFISDSQTALYPLSSGEKFRFVDSGVGREKRVC